jgi:hypothetical protein
MARALIGATQRRRGPPAATACAVRWPERARWATRASPAEMHAWLGLAPAESPARRVPQRGKTTVTNEV